MSTRSATDYKRFLHLLTPKKVAAPAAPAPVVTLPSANPFALTPEEEDRIMREVDEEYDEQLDRRILAEGVDTPCYSSPFDEEDAFARQEVRDLFSGELVAREVATEIPTYQVSCWEEMDTNPCGDTRCHMNSNTLTFQNDQHVWECCHGTWIYDTTEFPGIAGTPPPVPVRCGCPCNSDLLYCNTLLFRDPQRYSCLSWGDQAWLEDWMKEAYETAQEKATRLAKQAAADEASKKEILKYSITKKEEKWTKGGQMKFRVPRPCRYSSLFLEHTCAKCESKVPEGQNICTAQIIYVVGQEMRNGRMVDTDKLVPKVVKSGGILCKERLAGCWNHEATHTCIYIHPDEPQWKEACSGDLCYDRDTHKFHKKGECATCASCNPGIANRGKQQSRWAALGPQATGRPPVHPKHK
jgi:hypothetical protein